MNLNTKANRRKLVRTLFTVQRTRYDLLPFYSRLVATLNPCMPDVANDLVTALKGDFRWHVKKKDQINIESKLKTVRFIGELVKFNMFPKSEALHCLKMLLFDFSHHNIEMTCALVDTCGRFLYRSPDSHHRTKVYLDLMMRKKAALHLDSRYNTMIENAFYYSNPPEVSKEAKKVRPPMHEYIRKLLFKDLSKITTEKVLRQMRKLNWDEDDIAQYALKCLTAVWNVRYETYSVYLHKKFSEGYSIKKVWRGGQEKNSDPPSPYPFHIRRPPLSSLFPDHRPPPPSWEASHPHPPPPVAH